MAFDNYNTGRRDVLTALALGGGLAASTAYGNSIKSLDAEQQSAPTDGLRSRRSFEEFGAKPNGAMPPQALYQAIERAWESALKNGHDLHHPGGVYDIGERNFPWRQSGEPNVLLDCRNITISGNGPGSIFKTTSENGADVFQLNGVKNLHFRNLALNAALTGSTGSGSNGVSVTGGYDNITLFDIWCEALPYVDKGPSLDGGKALTIQCDDAKLEVGSLTARIFAKGCVQGFGFEAGLVRFLGKKTAVVVDIVAEDCFVAVAIGGGEARTPLADEMQWGIRVSARAINCQKDVWLARAYGVDVDCQTISTKSAAARRVGPTGMAWWADKPEVEALLCAYAKNSRINLAGNKGECDFKARIGGAPAGGSGQLGATTRCDIALDLDGRAKNAAIGEVDSGGNSLSFSSLSVTPATGPIPEGFYLPVRDNLLLYGTRMRLPHPLISGAITLTGRDGQTGIAELKLRDDGIAVRQLADSSDAKVVLMVLNSQDVPVAGFRNDGAIMSKSTIAAAGVAGPVVGVKPEYDADNKLRGYAPLYGRFIPR